MLIEYIEDLFKEEKGKTLLVFKSKDCAPCRVYEKILEVSKLDIDVYILDVYEHPEICSKYLVASTPTTILFEDGKEIKREFGIVRNLEEFVL